MPNGFAHMILEEEDGSGKKPRKIRVSFLVIGITLLLSLASFGLAIKALAEVTSLRYEISVQTEINRNLYGRNDNIPIPVVNGKALDKDTNTSEIDFLQNLTQTLKNDTKNRSKVHEQSLLSLEAKCLEMKRNFTIALATLNQNNLNVREHMSLIDLKQSKLDHDITNLTKVFNERNSFHEDRGHGTIQHQLFLEEQLHNAIQTMNAVKKNVDNNTKSIQNLGNMQGQHWNTILYLHNRTVDHAIETSNHFNHAMSVMQAQSWKSQNQINNISGDIHSMENRIFARFHYTDSRIRQIQNKSSGPTSQDFIHHQRLVSLQRNLLQKKINEVDESLFKVNAKTKKNSERIVALEAIEDHYWSFALNTSLALLNHSERLGTAEKQAVKENDEGSDYSNVTANGVVHSILDNNIRIRKNQRILSRLEKDFCESFGVIYDHLCIRMAYARGHEVNHTRAAEICKDQGGYLTEIENDYMIDLIVDLVNQTYRGNAYDVQLWTGNLFQNGDILTSTGATTSVTKRLFFAPNSSQGPYMGLYIGLDSNSPVGVYSTANNSPHQTPLCSFSYGQGV